MTTATALARLEVVAGERSDLAEALATLRAALTPKPRKKRAAPRGGFLTRKFPAHAGTSPDSLYFAAMGRGEDRAQYSREALAQFEQNAK